MHAVSPRDPLRFSCGQTPLERIRRTIKPYLYVLPIFLLATAFSYYPFVKTFVMSLCKVNARAQIQRFTGFDNYIKLFGRSAFQNSLLVTFRFAAMYLPLAVILPLLLALVARCRKPGSNVYQTMFAMPMAMSMAACSMVFKEIFKRKSGVLNYVLTQLGLYANATNIDWLNDKTWTLPALVIIQVWIHLGFNFMLLLAALRNVPQELLESADLEGAGYWRKVRHIMLPTISPTVFFVICTQMISGLMMSGPVLLLTRGDPQNSTATLIYYIYNSGFNNSNYALGSTASICAFAITFVFLLFNFIYEKKGVVYE